MIKAGDPVLITSGQYSDYHMKVATRAVKDFEYSDFHDKALQFVTEDSLWSSQEKHKIVDVEKFLAALLEEGWVEEIVAHELWLDDWCTVEDISNYSFMPSKIDSILD